MTSLAARPELLDVVAGWVWEAFWRKDGYALADVRSAYAGCIAEVGPSQTFVLLESGVPVGTASLVRHDLDERPALTPWLAGVYVVPERRGLGFVRYLLDAFDGACRAAGIDAAWLYTSTAEAIYARAGWVTTETVARVGKPSVVVMRRGFCADVMRA